ncbi:tRNA pseudouridine(38-40) synthase TruA [Aerococcaceae bacterium DSM 111020]|nr:tRNA pseudouridine(38-40) synthase TruA [Aerococcaceae bacterium DSM 111020]
MPNYAIKIEYDGSQYVGYQVQPNGPSIQSQIEKALRLMAKLPSDEKIPTIGSGRTDSGVHAKGQVVQFNYPATIEPKSLLKALNSILPDDIRVLAAAAVSEDFHARYSAISKTYRFIVNNESFPDPFTRLYSLHHPYPCDLERMQQAIQAIIGTHDFTSFCSTKTDKIDLVRTIYHASIIYQEPYFIFEFKGNGFLYNMIRILVGTILQIGDGLKPIDELEHLLEIKDRNQAGPTANGNGLYMIEVEYEWDPFSGANAYHL